MNAALLDDLGTSASGKFKSSRPLRVETYDYEPAPIALPSPAGKPLPLFSFVTPDGERRELRRPLPLRVSAEDGEIFVENEALSIFGHGKTLQAAVEAFTHDLAYFWQYYQTLTAEDVAGEGAVLKRIYEELVS